jgi:hypothetical protein
MPKAWQDLIEALTLLAKGQNNDISPTHCEHDQLTVMADPADFTEADLTRLNELGFFPNHDDATFTSFRFGSA